jgi:hypothetical protein
MSLSVLSSVLHLNDFTLYNLALCHSPKDRYIKTALKDIIKMEFREVVLLN